MALTRHFKETVQARVRRDPKFSRALFEEAVNQLLAGDVEVGKSMLRDYINATVSFKPLARSLHKDSKSIQRMLGPQGNPTSKSLFAMLHALQKAEGLELRVSAKACRH